MKTLPFKSSLILAILMFILPGCLNIQFITDVHRDGSISQMIVFEGDSTEITKARFALMNEPDWKKEWTRIDKEKSKLVVTKEFRSVKELNASMNPADTSLLLIRVNSTLDKKFRWFFTRFTFEETIQRANPFIGLNYKDFLNEEEIRLISMNDDNRKADPKYDSVSYKATEKKFEDYLLRSMYEDFYQQVTSILKEDKSLSLTPEELAQNKENIYHFLMDSTQGDRPEAILDGFGRIFKSQAFQVIKEKYLDRFDEFAQKLSFYQESSDDSYKFNIRMPGLLLQTNSTKIEGSQANWEIGYYEFFFRSYTMKAESRVVNAWAFIVAGIILLAALAGFVILFRRKR